VSVSAKDLGTNKEQKITITASSGLSKDEISKMTKDAESHASEDEQQREAIEAKNKLDGMIYSTEKILKENRDKISESDASALDATISRAKSVLEQSKETRELNAALEDLTKASHKLAEAMYQKTTQQPPPGAGAGAGTGPKDDGAKKKDDEVIDAEYVDVDENKNK
jgi:molecular chaperone DnaK